MGEYWINKIAHDGGDTQAGRPEYIIKHPGKTFQNIIADSEEYDIFSTKAVHQVINY